MSPPPTLRVAAACALVPPLPLLARLWIQHSARPRIQSRATALPRRSVAIVPGCAVLADGTPSPMLADRLAAGLELFRRGVVTRILVSGDAHHARGDEASAMRGWLLGHGVPSGALLVDGASRRTRDTMAYAAGELDLHGVIVCTQRFHLPRAVYLARHAGLDALGLEADRRRYRDSAFDALRELAAQTAAFVEVQL